MMRRPPSSPLFPYPPLFRSQEAAAQRVPHALGLLHDLFQHEVLVPAALDRGEVPLHMRDRLLLLDGGEVEDAVVVDRKSTRLNSSHSQISYAVFCLKKKQYS